MSSTFGNIYRVTTFGESHCYGVGAVVDGCPANLKLCEADIQPQLDRRRPGQSRISTPRNEQDQIRILSGTEGGVTLGTPIGLLVKNRDQRPSDYKKMSDIPRPSHADMTYLAKYGVKASSGGGRSSARETIGRVAAGAIAEKWLRENLGCETVAWVSAVGDIDFEYDPENSFSRYQVDANIMRCPQSKLAERMIALVEDVRAGGDSVGGVLTCECRNVPAGLGEPVFGKLEALLAQAMLSIPSVKGFEIGSGFSGARMRGSQHNDPFLFRDGKLGTTTNYSGGVQGGISNGEKIYFRVAFKPPATISRSQNTVDMNGNHVVLQAEGRHDPCVVPRAVPIVETMAAIVVMDLVLNQYSKKGKDNC